jgi:hypothetical protein
MITMLKNPETQTTRQPSLAELFADLIPPADTPRCATGFPLSGNRLPARRQETAEMRRRRMIRDTERYLNDPRSTCWSRLS